MSCSRVPWVLFSGIWFPAFCSRFGTWPEPSPLLFGPWACLPALAPSFRISVPRQPPRGEQVLFSAVCGFNKSVWSLWDFGCLAHISAGKPTILSALEGNRIVELDCGLLFVPVVFVTLQLVHICPYLVHSSFLLLLHNAVVGGFRQLIFSEIDFVRRGSSRPHGSTRCRETATSIPPGNCRVAQTCYGSPNPVLPNPCAPQSFVRASHC